jgi:hypothetical protein
MTDSLQEWILQYNSGMAWFNKLGSVNTKRTYLPNFKRYCEWVKKNPDELIQLKIEGLQSINTPKEFQAENLLETFLSTCKSPSSIKDIIRTAVISFYKGNRRPLAEIVEVTALELKNYIDLDRPVAKLRQYLIDHRNDPVSHSKIMVDTGLTAQQMDKAKETLFKRSEIKMENVKTVTGNRTYEGVFYKYTDKL